MIDSVLWEDISNKTLLRIKVNVAMLQKNRVIKVKHFRPQIQKQFGE